MDGLWAKKMCLVEAKELKAACGETTKSPGMVLIRYAFTSASKKAIDTLAFNLTKD